MTSIITDLDAAFIDTAPVVGEKESDTKYKRKCERSEEAGSRRRDALDLLVRDNPWLNVYYAAHTFEVDFALSGNIEPLISLVPNVYSDPDMVDLATTELGSGDIALYGRRVLTMANYSGKGWFAILLSKFITPRTIIPQYIFKAVFSQRQNLSAELLYNICAYRVKTWVDRKVIDQRGGETAMTVLDLYRLDLDSWGAVKESLFKLNPDDQIHSILEEIE